MKSRIFAPLLALVMLFGSQSAKAWGWFGHGGIVYVAEKHLTPEAKEKCRYYLKHTLPYYASWMDYWRGSEHFKPVNRYHSNRATKDGKNVDFKIGKPDGRVMGYLINALAELGDGKYKNLPDSVVRQRLINMVHYLPDMHCPSHIHFPKKEFPQYNYNRVLTNGKEATYHAFWDGSPRLDRKEWTIEDYGKNIDKVSRKQIKAWQSGCIKDWGYDMVRAGRLARELLPEGTETTTLTKAQKKEIHKLSDEMAMMAAYRLAYVLNTIFSDGNIPVSK